jgi:hypothetical protein
VLLLATGCATLPYSIGLRGGGNERPAAVVVLERHFANGRYAGDSDVVAHQVSEGGAPLWNANSSGAYTVSVPVASSEFSERAPVAVPDGRGGTFVAYVVSPNDGPVAGHTRVWAQHIDADGVPSWNDGLRSIEAGFNPSYLASNPVLVADGRGGVIVIYEAAFTDGEHAGDVDLIAQRITRSGVVLWGSGTMVASSRMVERSPSAVSDGRGGVVIVFEAEARDGEYAGDTEIMAQRVDRRGRLVFHDGARSLVVSAGRVQERAPVAVSDGHGGAIAVFEQHVIDGPYAGRVWIAGQRVTRSGRLSWNAGERSSAVSLGPYVHSGLDAVSDGQGGVIAVFEGLLAESDEAVTPEIFAQRVDGQGRLLYGLGDQAAPVASSDVPDVRPQVVADGRGGAVVVFEQEREAGVRSDLSAQHLDGQGVRTWGDLGRASVVVAQDLIPGRPRVLSSDGRGGVLVFYEETLADVAILDHKVIRGQRVAADGVPSWHGGERAVVVSGSLASEQNPSVARP